MSDARLQALPIPFTFDNQTYQLVARDFRIEGLFQVWAEEEAYAALARHRKRLGPDYDAQLKGWRYDLGAKVYAWGGEQAHKLAFSEPGMRHLAYLKLKAGEEHGGAEVERELIDRIAADADKWRELTDKILEQDYPSR